MKTIKTKITSYCFDTSKQDQRDKHIALVGKLKSTPGRGKWMNCISVPPYKPLKCAGGHGTFDVELDTEFLFANQWNTVATKESKGERVFDWYEEAMLNGSRMRFGHYLDITQEMIDIRDSVMVCGYTGMHFRNGESGFNLSKRALGSPYLKEEELYLLRLKPVSFIGSRDPLSERERSFLLPLYVEAQTVCSKERRAKLASDRRTASLQSRDHAIAEAERSIEIARKKCDGILWLIDHDIETENCIFYDHTNMFEFGWRSGGVSPSVAEELRKKLDGFPHKYEIKVQS